jgi:hypothetical protein
MIYTEKYKMVLMFFWCWMHNGLWLLAGKRRFIPKQNYLFSRLLVDTKTIKPNMFFSQLLVATQN